MKTGEKVLLGAVIIIPVSFLGIKYLTKPKLNGEIAGYLGGEWQFWQNLEKYGETMESWKRLEPGLNLAVDVPTYFSVPGINKSETIRKIHIDLVLSGDAIEDTKLPAYVNQDKKAEPDQAWWVGFGPVVLPESGNYRLDATLKVNGKIVDTDSIEFQAFH